MSVTTVTTGKLNGLNVHEQNAAVAEAVAQAAQEAGLAIRHNASGLGNHDGYHRWVVLKPETVSETNYSCRSKGCLYYSQARYARWGKPSIIQEREALLDVLEFLQESRVEARWRMIRKNGSCEVIISATLADLEDDHVTRTFGLGDEEKAEMKTEKGLVRIRVFLEADTSEPWYLLESYELHLQRDAEPHWYRVPYSETRNVSFSSVIGKVAPEAAAAITEWYEQQDGGNGK